MQNLVLKASEQIRCVQDDAATEVDKIMAKFADQEKYRQSVEAWLVEVNSPEAVGILQAQIEEVDQHKKYL
jgi:hypothetical protein